MPKETMFCSGNSTTASRVKSSILRRMVRTLDVGGWSA
jgi:hypothetical protein